MTQTRVLRCRTISGVIFGVGLNQYWKRFNRFIAGSERT
jgi:hypothetical protein